MRNIRPLVGLAATTAVVALALPSQAAGATRTLYFDNEGASTASGCTPGYVLTKSQPSGAPCEAPTVAAQGQGPAKATDVFDSLASSVGFRIDAKRPLTGTVFVTNYPLISGGAGPASVPNSMGGPAGADVTIKINNVKVGTASGSGVATPNGAFAIPVKLKIPASLNGKVVKTVEAVVAMNTGVVLTGASYAGDTKSKLLIPTR
jgi:hypothetical protein